MQLAVVEVVHGVVKSVERVDARLQGDTALGGERHQLIEVVVGADQVADEVDQAV